MALVDNSLQTSLQRILCDECQKRERTQRKSTDPEINGFHETNLPNYAQGK